MSINRFGGKGTIRGAASLIAPFLRKNSLYHQTRTTSLLAGGTDRIAGVPDEAGYTAPGGLKSPYKNFITVAKDGGDYNSIRDAMDAVQDEHACNTYCIFVYPGVYDEQVVMKEYVSLVGLDRDLCIIKSADYDIVVSMANYSSLNEIQVINEKPASASTVTAVQAFSKSHFFLDSCIVRSTATGAGWAVGFYAWFSNDFQVLGSEVYVNSSNSAAIAVAIVVGTVGLTGCQFRHSKFEVESGGGGSAAWESWVQAPNDSPLDAEIVACHLIVANDTASHDGIYVIGGATQIANVDVVATDIEHMSNNGGGYDLNSAGNSSINVRAVRYSTWYAETGDGGFIFSLMGDRPVRTCLDDGTDFTITEAVNAYQSDPNGLLAVSVPCRSDLVVIGAIGWYSDTVRAQSFSARVLVDGAIVPGMAYAGEPVASHYQNYAFNACAADLDAGNHTIQLQARRANAGDTVVVDQRQLAAMTFPYP